MSDVIRLVAGDDYPIIRLTLTDDVTGAAIDLSDGTTSVSVKFRVTGSTTILSTISCAKVSGGSTGIVQFDFTGDVLDVDPGSYEGDIVIDFDGSLQTVYDTLRFRVR